MANILPGDQVGIPKSIGALGDIAFECSSELVRTLTDYQRDVKARFATHNLIMHPPALEFLGIDTGAISFRMIFTTALNVDPQDEAAKLRKMCEEGQANTLVLGSEVIGELWVIESVSESAQAFDGRGKIIVSEVDVRLKEYHENVV